MKLCCKCNGCADQEARHGKLWYCYDCFRIRFYTNDKIKKYRPKVKWNWKPMIEKPF